MSEAFQTIESLLDKAKAYANTRIAQVKLSVAEKVSQLLSTLVAGLMTVLVFLFALLLGSVAAALLIGEALGKVWLGFAIIAAAWLLLGILLWKGRNRFLRLPIMNSMIASLFSKESEDEED